MNLMRAMLSVIVCANALLAGCASNVADDRWALDQGVDQKRVAQVEAAARRAGVDVHWVNYPRKSTQ